MNNTIIKDLIGDYAINIGSTYDIKFQLCNAPDLTEYVGACQIRQSIPSIEILLSPIVTVLSKDIFGIKIPFDAYPENIAPGNYVYDVMFSKTDYRFYPIGGKCQLIQRVTRVI